MPAQNMTVYLSKMEMGKPSNLLILGLKDCLVLCVNIVTTILHSMTSLYLFAMVAGTCIILRLLMETA